MAKFFGTMIGQCILTCRGNAPNCHPGNLLAAVFAQLSTPQPNRSRVDAECQSDSASDSVPLEVAALKTALSKSVPSASMSPQSLLSPSVRTRIPVLQICSDDDDYSFDISNLSHWSRQIPGLFIEVQSIKAKDFPLRFKCHQCLRLQFDLIFIGGTDGSGRELGALTQRIIEDTLIPYHSGQGSIVFLHDATWNYTQGLQRWTYFLDLLGVPEQRSEDPEIGWETVKHKAQSDVRPEILSQPAELEEPLIVGLTHAGQAFGAKTTVMIGNTEQSTYYAENGRIATCEACHLPKWVTTNEWKFLVNVTCHLTGKWKSLSE
jgi:hypothetical protein